MVFKGRAAWVFPDSFDADLIVGVEHIGTLDLEIIKNNLMKAYDPGFGTKVKKGDMLIGGKNFGYGHPHPQAMNGMRALGVEVIVAEQFFQVFYRAELASGTKLFTCPGVTESVGRFDELELDTEKAVLVNKTRGVTLALDPVDEYPLYIMEHGIVEFIKAVNSGEIK